ncbi:MAG: NAD(P)-dependent oxidoreductase [Micropepsaceae bacterium]
MKPDDLLQAFAGCRVLVTGASGFIGRQLVARLHTLGAVVTVIKRAGTGDEIENVIEVERWKADTLRQVLAGSSFDYVFHLAAYGVAPSARDVQEMFEVNVSSTIALVDTVRAARSIVHVGSCAEYSSPQEPHRITESHGLEAFNLYGATKAAGTLGATAAAAARGHNFVAARLFHVFGTNEASHRLLPTLVSHLKLGKPVPLSPGTQVRDFLAASDAVEGLLHLAVSAAALGGQSIVNLCSGTAVSVRSFAECVADALRAPRNLLDFGAVRLRSDETTHLVGDTARLHQLVTWRPRLSLTEGIEEALRASR